MNAEAMSELFGEVAGKLGPALMGSAPLDHISGELESRASLNQEQLAGLLGPGEIAGGWAMYQSGLQGRIEGIPPIRDEALGQLMAAEWCDANGAAVTVRAESGGLYRWTCWTPGQGKAWLCDERRFRTTDGQAVKYLRLWSGEKDAQTAWRPVAAVFAGFEKSGEQA